MSKTSSIAINGTLRDNLLLKQVRFHLLPLCCALLGAAFGMLSLSAYLYESSKLSVVPYVITVDKSGAVIARDDLKGEIDIPERAIASSLGSFIEDLRTRTEDPQITAKNVRAVYARLKENSQAFLEVDKFYKEHPREEDIYTELTSILRISNKVFQIDWCEDSKNQKRKCLRAHLGYEIHKSASDLMALRLNPLGIKIHELQISPLLTSS